MSLQSAYDHQTDDAPSVACSCSRYDAEAAPAGECGECDGCAGHPHDSMGACDVEACTVCGCGADCACAALADERRAAQ